MNSFGQFESADEKAERLRQLSAQNAAEEKRLKDIVAQQTALVDDLKVKNQSLASRFEQVSALLDTALQANKDLQDQLATALQKLEAAERTVKEELQTNLKRLQDQHTEANQQLTEKSDAISSMIEASLYNSQKMVEEQGNFLRNYMGDIRSMALGRAESWAADSPAKRGRGDELVDVEIDGSPSKSELDVSSLEEREP